MTNGARGACTAAVEYLSLVIPNVVRNLLSFHFRRRWIERSTPVLGKVFPRGIEALNQNNFLVPRPALHLCFPGDAIVHILKRFEVHQPVDLVFLGEAFDLAFFVLHHSIEQRVCHADINAARLAGHNIDVEFPLAAQSRFLTAFGMTRG